MNKLIGVARIFFCLGMIGLGVLQFYYGQFRPVFVPLWATWLPGMKICLYICSTLFILLPICILADKRAKDASLVLAAIMLIFLVFAEIPFMLTVNAYPEHLGSWTDPLKVLALAGSAFVVAGSFVEASNIESPALAFLTPLICWGKIFFAVTMLLFGIDHFLYTEFVDTLVPDWIPGHVFWTDFAGVALIGTGASIILNIKRREVCILAAIMLLLWTVILHIPRTMGRPEIADRPNEMTSVCEALLFSGVAFLIAMETSKKVQSTGCS
jgi:uncharacterized membrane protein